MSTTPEAGRAQEHPSTRAHCSQEPFLGAEGLALAGLILRAFATRTGHDLVPAGAPEERARALFDLPMLVAAQGRGPHGDDGGGPMIYGNRVALRLFDCSWETFRRLVGHDTAPVELRAERRDAVRRVREAGRIDGYSCVRTAVTGRRFALAHATVCVIDDEDGAYAGYVAIAEVGDAVGGGR